MNKRRKISQKIFTALVILISFAVLTPSFCEAALAPAPTTQSTPSSTPTSTPTSTTTTSTTSTTTSTPTAYSKQSTNQPQRKANSIDTWAAYQRCISDKRKLHTATSRTIKQICHEQSQQLKTQQK